MNVRTPSLAYVPSASIDALRANRDPHNKQPQRCSAGLPLPPELISAICADLAPEDCEQFAQSNALHFDVIQATRGEIFAQKLANAVVDNNDARVAAAFSRVARRTTGLQLCASEQFVSSAQWHQEAQRLKDVLRQTENLERLELYHPGLAVQAGQLPLADLVWPKKIRALQLCSYVPIEQIAEDATWRSSLFVLLESADLKHLQHVSLLAIDGAQYVETTADTPLFAGTLQTVDMRNTWLQDRDWQRFLSSDLGGLESARFDWDSAHIQRNSIDDTRAQQFLQLPLLNLQWLSLQGDLSDASLQALAARNRPALQKLLFWAPGNLLTSATMQLFSGQAFANLQELAIHGHQLPLADLLEALARRRGTPLVSLTASHAQPFLMTITLAAAMLQRINGLAHLRFLGLRLQNAQPFGLIHLLRQLSPSLEKLDLMLNVLPHASITQCRAYCYQLEHTRLPRLQELILHVGNGTTPHIALRQQLQHEHTLLHALQLPALRQVSVAVLQ